MKLTFYYANPTSFTHKIGNFILKVGEWVKFGHFAVGIESYSGNWIYEAVFPKTRKLEKKEWDKKYIVFSEISWEVPEEFAGKVLEFLEEMVGKRYAVEQILSIAVSIILFPLKYFIVGLNLNGARALVCTEVGSRLAARFWGFIPTGSHDEIGLSEMFSAGSRYKDNVKWSLQPEKNS